ncbi:MAG: exodeoxyribonuclease VII small subunit [Ruminiclostridium sp.]|nr:exodeoxyribonuclease VII small subunit [Ruminiclostridium sp.]
MNFDEAYKRLNEISVEMERKDLSLEDSVKLYSEAANLVEICKKTLEEAKMKVTELEKADKK